MKKIWPISILLLLLILSLTSFTETSSTAIRKDFKRFYDQYEVGGSFILYDQKNDKYIIYNEKQLSTSFTPASTFKIYNSLIALESGAVKDESIVLKWDGKVRQVPEWNADSDMKNAFKNSTVWFYQDLARQTGGNQMKYWLDKIEYGNADTTGGIDGFWLWGGLRITPRQQVDLLRKLYNNKLAFSQRSMDIVKNMMIVQNTSGYIERGKAGAGRQGNQLIGWYVGYITTLDNVYYFANCIQSSNGSADFKGARVNIAHNILKELKIIVQ